MKNPKKIKMTTKKLDLNLAQSVMSLEIEQLHQAITEGLAKVEHSASQADAVNLLQDLELREARLHIMAKAISDMIDNVKGLKVLEYVNAIKVDTRPVLDELHEARKAIAEGIIIRTGYTFAEEQPDAHSEYHG